MRHHELFDSLCRYFPGVSKVDPRVSIMMHRRNVSAEWIRGGYTSVDPAGFNPFTGQVFYSRYSSLDELNDAGSDAVLNPDLLLYEVFYALHDFVHIWSLHELARMNSHAIGPWNRTEDVDSAWFKLLLLFSEAAATATVDYWMLSSRPLSAQVGQENTFTTLTTPFDANRDSALIDGNPFGVEVQSPTFLVELALTYSVGWMGPLRDLMRGFGCHPPDWLVRERNQARRQSKLADDWLAVLRGNRDRIATIGLDRFEACRPQLLNIATRLRHWIDSNSISETQVHAPIVGWCDSLPIGLDFRFLNAPRWLEFCPTLDDRELGDESRTYFNSQIMSRIRPGELLALKEVFRGKTLAEIPSLELVEATRSVASLSGEPNGPLNLFFVS